MTKYIIIFVTFIFSYTLYAQCTPFIPPGISSSGVVVTEAASINVVNFPGNITHCGYTTPVDALWLGGGDQYSEYTLTFSCPVNDIQFIYTAGGNLPTEEYTFTTNTQVSILTFQGCNTSIVGNTAFMGTGPDQEDHAGGILTVTSTTSYTSITISTPGDANGALFALCDESIGVYDINIISSATEICLGDELTLTATSQTGGVITLDNGAPNGLEFIPGSTGVITYVATSTSADDCLSSIDILVNELPTIVVNADDPEVCDGELVTLTGGGASIYNWDGGVIDGQPFAPPIGTTTYTVTGVDDDGCENSDSIDLVVNELPIVTASVEYTGLCSDVTLTGGGATTYTWDGGITDSVPFSPPSGTNTYTVTGIDDNGCESTASIDVTSSQPTVTANADNTEVCEGETVTLTGGGATTYTWDGGVIDGVPIIPPAGTTSYTVIGVDDNGCESTASIDITTYLPGVIANADNTDLCEGDMVTLSGSGATTYIWSNGVTDGEAFIPSVGSNTYTVTGVDDNGCESSDEIEIYIESHPDLSFDFVQNGNCAPVTVTFTNTSSPSTVTNCVWNLEDGTTFNGCGPFTHTFTQPGMYGASLYAETLENGCGSDVYYEDIINVDPIPLASFTVNPSTTTTLNTLVTFDNTSIGASNYQWDFGDETSSSLINPSHTYSDESDGEYLVTLIATTDAGCADTAVKIVKIDEELLFYVPNSFTPDKDMYNDVFQPVFTSGFDPYDFSLIIFNRWGEIVFESHDSTIGWPGTYGSNGTLKICQDGVYSWVIEFKTTSTDERQRHVGHVSLIR